VRARPQLLACVTLVGLITLWAYWPRLGHLFPSMVDDWSAIANAPEQLRDVLALGNPEEGRYRPGFIVWNALQWHTLGAPDALVAPQAWGLARAAVLVLGVTALAALLVVPASRHSGWRDARWLLVAGVPLVALTAPSLVIDVARYGPQEPLLVGCMSLGAVLLVWSSNELLEPRPLRRLVVPAIGAGVLLWAFGVLQKETSCCVMLLAPFLWPTLRDQRERWRRLSHGRRVAIAGIAGAILLPFVPMAARLIEFALADERFYGAEAARQGILDDLSDQVSRAGEVLHSNVPAMLVVVGVILLAVGLVRFGVDWLSIGMLVVALAFVGFAAESGVVASRYYLPAIVLAALVVARAAIPLGSVPTLVTGLALLAAGTWQAHEARDWVQWWADGERDQETIVREAAGRAAGGCDVDVTGLNVEFVLALPVLMPIADEPPRGCTSSKRFVVVIDAGGSGTETPPTDPTLAACAPEPEPVWSSHMAKILRCTT
jgi:hypothetical protein